MSSRCFKFITSNIILVYMSNITLFIMSNCKDCDNLAVIGNTVILFSLESVRNVKTTLL
jgi:hypothetical protein